jgi:hypothetical protein
MKLKKIFSMLTILVILSILTISIATSNHSEVFVDSTFKLDQIGAVLEDTEGTYDITKKVYPLSSPTNSHQVTDFTYAVTNKVPTTANVSVSTQGVITATFPDEGAASFDLTVTDNANNAFTDTETISLTVTKTDSQAYFTTATHSVASFAEDSLTLANPGKLDLVSLTNNDGETNDDVTYSITLENPTLLDCTINGTDLVYYPVENFFGTSTCVVSVTDNGSTISAGTNPTSMTVTFTVNPLNDIPKYIATSNIITAQKNTDLTIDMTKLFKDDDKDTLIYTVNSKDDTKISSITFNGNTATVKFVSGFTGQTKIKLAASDAANGADPVIGEELTIKIDGSPSIDTLKADKTGTINEGDKVTFTATSSDPESQTLTKSWSVNGAIISGQTGDSYEHTFSFESAGANTITHKVVDPDGNSASEDIVITVTDVTRGLSIKTLNPRSANILLAASQTATFSADLTNSANIPVSYEWKLDDTVSGSSTTFPYTAPAVKKDQKLVLTVSPADTTQTDVKPVSLTWTIQVQDKPISTSGNLAGTIINFKPEDLAKATRVTVEKAGVGKIDWGSQEIDLTKVVDLDNFISIESNLVALDSSQFTVLNKPATITIENVAYTEKPKIFISSEFTTDGTKVTTECTTCKIESYTPEPASSGTVTFTVSSFSTYKVGNAVGKSTIPGLKITELRVDGTRFKIDEEGTSVADDIKPGDEIDIKVEVENTFQDKNDPDIEDIEIKVTIIGIEDDDEDDLEKESSTFDLAPRRNEDVTFKFDIPNEVEHNKKYRVRVEVDGRDEDGRKYNALAQGYVKIEKDDHDVYIHEFDLSPSTLRCTNTLSADIEIINRGEDDERDARLRIYSDALNIDRTINFDLDEDPDKDDFKYEKNFLFTVGDNIEEGEYKITLETFYDKDRASNKEERIVKVTGCQDQTVNTNSGSKGTSVSVASGSVPVGLIGKDKFTGMSDEEVLLIVVLGGIAVILALLVGIVFMIPKKKKAKRRSALKRKRAKRDSKNDEDA